jgi:hypothetical protein
MVSESDKEVSLTIDLKDIPDFTVDPSLFVKGKDFYIEVVCGSIH